MTRAHWSDALDKIGACEGALAWCKTKRTAASAWKTCKRGDWLLWIAAKLSKPIGSPAHRQVVLAACACARLALPHWDKWDPNDKRVLVCIETAEKWARNEGGITLGDVRRARYAAYAAYAADYASAAAADYAAADAAAYAASAADYAAAYAAYAADYAAADAAAYAASAADYAAAYAADYAAASAADYAAAYAAAYAASAAAYAARAKVLADCADIVRRMIPMPKI